MGSGRSCATGALAALVLSLGFWTAATPPAQADGAETLALRMASVIGQEGAGLARLDGERVRALLTPPKLDAGRLAMHSRDWLLARPEARGGDEWRCLTTALYFEARGEAVPGQFAVAEVILNRVDSPRYPDTICGVVYQGARNSGACQFSFACDGNPETMHERGAYALAGRIARVMKDGAPRVLTGGATHFHTTAVNPRWSRVYELTAEIGAHRFYRRPMEVASN